MANWAWPEIIDQDSARTAAHTAAGWAIFVAGLTTLLAVIGMFTGPVMGITASALVDAALFGVVAWRVWNGSRGWAIAGLALYSLEIIYNVVNHPPGVGILTILVVLALVNGVRGTFSLHKYEEERKNAWMQQQAAAQAQAFAATMPSSGTPPPPPPPVA